MKLTKTQIYLILGLILLIIFVSPGGKTYKLRPLTKNSVVLAFGDSLTHGTGADTENSYPALLSHILCLKVVNSGIPGERSAAGLQRLPGILSKVHPDLVILCHGGNDILGGLSAEVLESNLTEMIQLIRKSGSEVILVSVPKKGLILSTLPLYQTLADKLQIPCENEIMTTVLSKRALKSDYVHPNDKGYKKIAEALEKLINQSTK